MSWAPQGKAGGKSSGKGQGHKLPRTRITAEKFSGHCVFWKGNYGWILPVEPIQHDLAEKNNGKLFVSKDSIGDLTELTPGSPCEFHIWEDSTGLGADEVIELGPVDPNFEIPPPPGQGGKNGGSKGESTKGYGKAFAPVANSWDAGGKSNSKGWAAGGAGKGNSWDTGASKSWIATPQPAKGWTATPQAAKGAPKGGAKGGWGAATASPPVYSGFGAKGKDKDGGKGKDGKGKGKDGKGKTPGHLLERTRITAEKFTGTVKEWKGKFGWIQPAEPIDHPAAGKRDGALYVSMSDIQGGQELTPGATVEFHIAEDKAGLGAEEVVQY